MDVCIDSRSASANGARLFQVGSRGKAPGGGQGAVPPEAPRPIFKSSHLCIDLSTLISVTVFLLSNLLSSNVLQSC